ncbi:hypothetical protein D3C85_747110 [compost metagenome]
MTQHTLTTTLHFPPDYKLPEDCSIDINIRNITDSNSTYPHCTWGSNKLPSGLPMQFTFNIDSDQANVGERFSMDVRIAHQGTALLLDVEQRFSWKGGDHTVDIYLSPVGWIAIQKTWMPRIGYPEDSKLFVTLLEKTPDGSPGIVLSEGQHLTQDIQPFYLHYDPLLVKPGQRYALTGTFETHGQGRLSLGLSPKELVLLPAPLQAPVFGS